MKLKKEEEDKRTDGTRQDDKTAVGGEGAEEEEEAPSIPTPRKRLLNFKIPLVRGAGQRRDQQMSVVARRKLFKEGTCITCTCTCIIHV